MLTPNDFFNKELKSNGIRGIENFEGMNDSGRQSNTIFKSIAYPSKIYYPHIQKFIREYTNEGAVVLDSFSGSGSTGIAAAIENRKAVLIDDSPYANFIQKNIFSILDLNKIEKEYKKIINDLKPDIDLIYRTKSETGEIGVLQTIISSNIYRCPNCNNDMDLNNNETGVRSEYMCPNCETKINIAEQSIKDLKVESRRPVEVILKYKDPNTKKIIKENRKVSQRDIEDWDNNVAIVMEKYPELWEPDERIVYNRSYPRVGGWPGFPIHSKVGALFSEKNLLALKIFNNYIEKKIDDSEIKLFFKFVFTESLFRSSSRLFKSSGIKNVYHIPPIGKEQNVLTVFERKYKTLFKCEQFVEDLITPEQKNNIISIKTNARELPFENNLFDYAFIDPPYGGIVPYAELNLFYSAWLDEKEDLENEINIPMDYDKKQEWAEVWGTMIEEAFSEVFRVLKPGAYFTLVFQSKFDTIWNVLRDIMINRIGFEFVDFVGNERGTTFHTNSVNDTNPKSAYITYMKPINASKKAMSQQLVFDLIPNNYLNEEHTFRELQDTIITLVHKHNLQEIPSDKMIKNWIDGKAKINSNN
ncbi:DNA methyltransferase [Enterococcus faecalis]|uniref:DNA methyltransferase n=1 Tax=Enterococcus faecalis TaxID=1351 RepID=UPI003D6A9F63